MASTVMTATTTPAGLLTAGEVISRYAEMRRRVNLFIPTSACLFRAVGDLCASAVMGPGGQSWLPESVSNRCRITLMTIRDYIIMSCTPILSMRIIR